MILVNIEYVAPTNYDDVGVKNAIFPKHLECKPSIGDTIYGYSTSPDHDLGDDCFVVVAVNHSNTTALNVTVMYKPLVNFNNGLKLEYTYPHEQEHKKDDEAPPCFSLLAEGKSEDDIGDCHMCELLLKCANHLG